MKRLAFLYLNSLPELEPVALGNWWANVLDALCDLTPTIEDAGTGRAYLEAAGMAGLYGGDAAWCQAVLRTAKRVGLESVPTTDWRMGVAGTKFGAEIAAKSASINTGYYLVTVDERRWLAVQSLAWLPLDAETRRRCRLYGIHTIGQFAALPKVSVAEQFGPELLEIHAWARGKDVRVLASVRRQIVEVERELDGELYGENLVALIVLTVQPELARLQREGLTVRRLTIVASDLEGNNVERSAWLDVLPGHEMSQRVVARLVNGLAGELRDISAISVRLNGLDVQAGRQLDLFTNTSEQIRLEQTLRQLVRKHTSTCVLLPLLTAPYAAVASERYALEAYPL